MRTSLNEIKQIEDYLQQNISPEEAQQFEARLLLEPQLQEKLSWQKRVYHLIRQYGRRQLKRELNAVQNKVFTQSKYAGFQKSITRLFS